MVRIFVIAMILAGLVQMTFVNQTPAQSDRTDDVFGPEKVRLNLNNLMNQSEFARVNSGVLGKVSGLRLPRGTELVVIRDRVCDGVENADGAGLTKQAHLWRLDSEKSVSEIIAGAQADPCVVGIAENATARIFAPDLNNDPLFGNQEHLGLIDIDGSHDLFWRSSLAINADVTIAVLDSGVDDSHPDLSQQMWRGAEGQTGFDFINNDMVPRDDNGHGTHVAGLAAARANNQLGISGVMGFRAKVMAVKVVDQNGETNNIATVVNGIRYAIQNQAEVINMSLGGRGANTAVESALRDAVAAGIVIVAAAGNEGEQISAANFFFPAGYASSLAGMLAIGSINAPTGQRSAFSNFSPTYVELGAPGSAPNGGLISTVPGGGYIRFEGTSMATPVVAGAAGLVVGILKTHGLTRTPAAVEAILLEGSEKSAALTGAFRDGNRLNLRQLSEYLQNAIFFAGQAGFAGER